MINLERKNAILEYLKALNRLKDLNVIKNQKDFTSQLGEWLIAELFKGELALNGKQKDWDVKVGEQYFQVKSHAKSKTTKRTNTDIYYEENANIDFLIIVIFSEDYKLNELFKIPWKRAFKLITTNNKYPVIRWKDLNEFKIDYKNEFKNNPLIETFI
uniref:hypothetical protein n=1 Tax=Flavobacterium sp. TaxID=239 RepID=UPI00404B95B7